MKTDAHPEDMKVVTRGIYCGSIDLSLTGWPDSRKGVRSLDSYNPVNFRLPNSLLMLGFQLISLVYLGNQIFGFCGFHQVIISSQLHALYS